MPATRLGLTMVEVMAESCDQHCCQVSDGEMAGKSFIFANGPVATLSQREGVREVMVWVWLITFSYCFEEGHHLLITYP